MVDGPTQVGITLQQPTLLWASVTDTQARTSSRRHVQHCGHAHVCAYSFPVACVLFCSPVVQLVFMSHVAARDVGLGIICRRHLLGKYAVTIGYQATEHGRLRIASAFQCKFLFYPAVYVHSPLLLLLCAPTGHMPSPPSWDPFFFAVLQVNHIALGMKGQ